MWTGARPAASSLAREEKNLNFLSLLLPGRRGQNLNVSTVGSEHLLSLCTMHYNGASKTMVAASLMSLVLQPIPTVPICRATYPGTSVFSVSSAPVCATLPLVTLLSHWTVMCDAECHVSPARTRMTRSCVCVSPLQHVTNFPDSSSLAVLVLGQSSWRRVLIYGDMTVMTALKLQ